MRLVSVVLTGAALSSVAAAQQSPVPGPSIDAVISLKSAGSPPISPDGESIAYTVTSTEWSENRYDTEIWLWREGGASVQLTRTEKGNSTSPKWSPDGSWIAFLADRGDKQQIFLIAALGGEAWGLTSVPEGVQGFEWAPDSKRIAFTRSDPDPEASKQRKEHYGEFAIEDHEYRQTHLWLARVPGVGEPSRPDSQPQRLTEGDFNVSLRLQVYVAETKEAAQSEPEESFMSQFRRLGSAYAASSAVVPGQERVERAEVLSSLSWDQVMADRAAVGTPDMVVDRLRFLQKELNLSGVVAEFNAGGRIPPDKVSRSLALFCKEVMPAF